MRGNSSNFLVYHIYASNNKSIKGGIIMVALAGSIINSGINLMIIIWFSMFITIIGLIFAKKQQWIYLICLISDLLLILITTLGIPAFIIVGESCKSIICMIALELFILLSDVFFLLRKEK